MLNPDSASHPLVQFGEILKQVQDDTSKKFQICLVRFQIFQSAICNLRSTVVFPDFLQDLFGGGEGTRRPSVEIDLHIPIDRKPHILHHLPGI